MSYTPGAHMENVLDRTYIENYRINARMKTPDDEWFEGKEDARIQVLAEGYHHIGNAIEKFAEVIKSNKPPVNITINVYDTTDPKVVNEKIREIINGL